MRPLLGRDDELRALLAEDGAPRVGPTHIWGPAGVGKTHLVRVAFPNAIHCDLTECCSDADIIRVVGVALGLQHDAWQRLSVSRRLERETRVVVLDGADRCLNALKSLLDAWSGPRFVSTARQSDLDGHSIELRPLDKPDAVALWRRHFPQSDETLAGAIVDHVDRLPLAIEWVAARASLLGERACLARVRDDAFERDPLASALDDSLGSLTPEQLTVLERICAYRSGIDVESLEAAGELRVIEHLRTSSLVLRVGQRVRGYRSVIRRVSERASEDAWKDAIRRHATTTLARIEEHPERARIEWEELEAIQTRFVCAEPALATRAALLALPRALSEGRLDEARTRMTELLEHVGSSRAPDLHLGLARLERRAGQFECAREHAGSALGARPFEAELELAHLDRQQSHPERALSRLARALTRARTDEQLERECVALGEVGRVLQSLGRYREAQARHVEAIALCRTSASPRREALERSLHARATHRAGDVAEAIGLHEGALELHLNLGDLRLASAERGHLAFCHHELGAHDRAEGLFREAIEGLYAAGDVVLEHIERVLLARLLGDLGRTAEARLELGIAKAIDRNLAMPRLEFTRRLVAGWIEIADGRFEDAERELDAALALGVHVEVGFEALAGATLAAVQGRLGRLPPASDAETRAETNALNTESPGLARAFEVLLAIAADAPTPAVSRDALERSSDLRRALSLAGRAARVLKLTMDGRSFGFGAVDEVDLRRRAAPRRLLALLAERRRDEPGTSCTRDALIAAGWPDEKMRPEAADKRLRTAIWTLRKAGLEDVLLTREDGYLLDPQVDVDFSE